MLYKEKFPAGLGYHSFTLICRHFRAIAPALCHPLPLLFPLSIPVFVFHSHKGLLCRY